ncbi:ECF transporter S component [Anaerotignum sp. MSJ-24]|uniref:ECF transporter S component n=1 Tax=Anaerotignum sp. MSJ-24 TaxID=2841521 RepID=UPI001C113743|nr:ECF transporter S component [Anaerotignum sp. MSJ-24]MBD9220220.1 ECF transporter S component [Clostridiales bacterium]MBU5463951.1 ECF transporter S component [Anaerotignum sp. MSJ-24]
MNNSAAANTSSAKQVAINGISIALVFIATGFINLRLPIVANGGLIHLGNVPLFLAAIIFGKKTGAISGAVGMALFDLFSGWTLWAPFTFVIVGIMGWVVGKITEDKSHNTILWYVIAILAALAIKIVGYYIAEGIIYGNWVAPAASIPGNIVQILTAAVIVLPLAKPLKKQLSAITRS